jgi:hypothetical protein
MISRLGQLIEWKLLVDTVSTSLYPSLNISAKWRCGDANDQTCVQGLLETPFHQTRSANLVVIDQLKDLKLGIERSERHISDNLQVLPVVSSVIGLRKVRMTSGRAQRIPFSQPDQADPIVNPCPLVQAKISFPRTRTVFSSSSTSLFDSQSQHQPRLEKKRMLGGVPYILSAFRCLAIWMAARPTPQHLNDIASPHVEQARPYFLESIPWSSTRQWYRQQESMLPLCRWADAGFSNT